MSDRHLAVIGATGQLGTDIVEHFAASNGWTVTGLGHEDVEIADAASVCAALTDKGFAAVVNCAAMHNVNACEDDPQAAFRINVCGQLNVARVCAEIGAECVFISSDYVFGGEEGGPKDGPYVESDPAWPTNVYGICKLAAERATAMAAPAWMVLRIASVYGKTGARNKGGSNFVEMVVSRAKAGEPLKIIDDVTMSPTYTMDAARALRDLLEAGARGVFHATNSGGCTWHEFASAILEMAGLRADMTPVPASTFPAKGGRPMNSSMASERLREAIGREMPHWHDGLRAYLAEKGHIR